MPHMTQSVETELKGQPNENPSIFIGKVDVPNKVHVLDQSCQSFKGAVVVTLLQQFNYVLSRLVIKYGVGFTADL